MCSKVIRQRRSGNYESPCRNAKKNVKHLKYLINTIESVQKLLTKRLPGLRNIPYTKRLELLKLNSLEYRRIFHDLTLCYQILNGWDTIIAGCFIYCSDDITRGNHYKPYKRSFTVDATK